MMDYFISWFLFTADLELRTSLTPLGHQKTWKTMARREREPFVSITVVLIQKYTQHHMKFDLSPFSEITRLKQELARALKIPSERQKWLLRKSEVDDRRCLNDYNVCEADVIELHLRGV